MHSHIAGVAGPAAGRTVGFALKVHQRAWALAAASPRSAGRSTRWWPATPTSTWGKLAADAVQYLPNFYGLMNDGINGSDDTDRLFVHWRLDDPVVAAACTGVPRTCSAAAARDRGAVVALARSAHDRPVPGSMDGDTILVAVPTDIETLRSVYPGRRRSGGRPSGTCLPRCWPTGPRSPGFDRSRLVRARAWSRAERGRDEADRSRAAADQHAAGVAVPHLVRHPRRNATCCCVRAVTADAEGWGECVAMTDPLYSSGTSTRPPTCCAGS